MLCFRQASVIAVASMLTTLAAAQQAPPPRATPPASPQTVRDLIPPAGGTGSLRGRVVRGDTGAPIAHVRLSAMDARGGSFHGTLSDERGNWELAGLAPGQYRVSASKTGFVTTAYGQRHVAESGLPLTVTARQTLEGIDVALPPAGAIEGVVVDESGDPVAGAAVQALRSRYVNGQRRLVAVSANAVRDLTDDLGRFRLYGLPAGEYYLQADLPLEPGASATVSRIAPGGGRGTGPTYYPGTPSSTLAQPLPVKPGQSWTGIVVPLAFVPLATISATMLRADGSPAKTGFISVSQLAETGSTVVRTAYVGAGAAFSIAHLPPGEYTVLAQVPDDESAIARVSLDGSDVALALRAGKEPRARGRIRAEGGATPVGLPPDAVRINMLSLDNMPRFDPSALTMALADWTFDVPAVAGRALVRPTLPEGWHLMSVSRRGIDLTDTPLEFQQDVDGIEIVLTRRTTLVSGTVSTASGARTGDATVAVFADDPARWAPYSRFIRALRPDREGRFTVRDLPPGRYRAVAIDYLESGEETNPTRLAQLRPLGTELTLSHGESRQIDLRISEQP